MYILLQIYQEKFIVSKTTQKKLVGLSEKPVPKTSCSFSTVSVKLFHMNIAGSGLLNGTESSSFPHAGSLQKLIKILEMCMYFSTLLN